MAGSDGGAVPVASAEMPDMYEVTVEGNGIAARRSVTQDVALRVVTLLMSGADGPLPRVAHAGSSQQRSYDVSAGEPRLDGSESLIEDHDDVPESVGEFLERVEAKRNPDKITAIAYFLRERGTLLFSREEIRAQFERAGEPMPGNYARDWRWTLGSRWIAPSSDDTEKFYLTRLGRKAVDVHFSDEVRKPLQQPRHSRRSNVQDSEKSDQNGDEA